MTGMMDTRQITAIATAQAATFDLSGILVQHPTRTSNNNGAYHESWATIATVNGGWAKPDAKTMQAYAGLIGAQKAWTVRLPLGTTVARNDRLVMPSGDTLTVQADLSERSYATCVRLLATEVV